MADHHSNRLLSTALTQPLADQIGIADQTGALMGPKGASTDQTSIGPGQGLLQNVSITLTTKLGCST
mgnify:CR=1 FL=1